MMLKKIVTIYLIFIATCNVYASKDALEQPRRTVCVESQEPLVSSSTRRKDSEKTSVSNTVPVSDKQASAEDTPYTYSLSSKQGVEACRQELAKKIATYKKETQGAAECSKAKQKAFADAKALAALQPLEPVNLTPRQEAMSRLHALSQITDLEVEFIPPVSKKNPGIEHSVPHEAPALDSDEESAVNAYRSVADRVQAPEHSVAPPPPVIIVIKKEKILALAPEPLKISPPPPSVASRPRSLPREMPHYTQTALTTQDPAFFVNVLAQYRNTTERGPGSFSCLSRDKAGFAANFGAKLPTFYAKTLSHATSNIPLTFFTSSTSSLPAAFSKFLRSGESRR